MPWRWIFLLLMVEGSLWCQSEPLQLFILEKVKSAAPGTVISIPTQAQNLSIHPLTIVNHLELPPGFAVLPENDLMTHLAPGQIYQKTLQIRIPESAPVGEYPFSYRLISERNTSISVQDAGMILVAIPSPAETESKPPSLLAVESDLTAAPGEMIYLSFLIQNPHEYPIDCQFKLKTPYGWTQTGMNDSSLHLDPLETSLQLICVKVPTNALAGPTTLSAFITGGLEERQEMEIQIQSTVALKARIEERPDQFILICENGSNIPLPLQIQATTDPYCPLELEKGPFTIPPFSTVEIPINPDLSQTGHETKQFICLKMYGEEALEPLCQVPFTIDLYPSCSDEDDPWIRIPSQFRAFVLGENHQTVGVIELAGEGLLDLESGRKMEYCLRLPTDQRNVIYSVDQRLYLGFSDPDWDLDLGDTVYSLTPLTQYYRYGRGAGADGSEQGLFYGLHYTQNTMNTDYNPREACAYLGYSPFSQFSCSANYLHKTLSETPTSNIVTLETDFDPIPQIHCELEAGNNFLQKSSSHDTHAFRGELHGRVWRDTWFDIEKVYAGTDFFGYYQAMNLFTTTVDMPLARSLRSNISYTSLRQNFNRKDSDFCDILSPRQKQASATLTYQCQNGAALSLNGLLLNAKDAGRLEQYHFYQKWGSFNFLYAREGYTFNSTIAIGEQKDHLTGKTARGLQRYYGYLGKEMTDRLYASCFYEGGHIDYYNVLPWRNAYGGSLRYRYQNCSWVDLFLQKVNHKHDDYELSQISINLHHQFQNRHSIDLSLQRFIYKKHYPSNSFFLVTYNIPFGLPVKEKNDRGELSGYLFDNSNALPIPDALISLGGKQIRTDSQGRFHFARAPLGPQTLKADLLPGNLIAQENASPQVDIQRGKNSEIFISCLPSTSIQGSISLYEFEEDNPFLEDVAIVSVGALQGIRVTIDLNHGQEIYTCLTDIAGRFRFPKLRPGSWRVYITTDYLPPLHHLNMNDFVLDLEPGSAQELSLKALPEKRVMQKL